MPVFTFSGKDASGQKISGERQAVNKQALAQTLRRERITPGAIREKGKEFSMPTFGTTKVKVKDIAIFFRQFSVMIDPGREPGESRVPEDSDGRAHHGRRGRDPGQCDAAVSDSLRCSNHQYDRGR